MTTRISVWLRRSVRAVTILSCAALAAPPAGAQATEPSYPARPIRIVVPQSPGGTVDLLSRMLADRMEKELDVAVVVDNKPGANGVIGNDAVKRASPDGHVLLAASTSTHAMTPHVVADLPYDPLRDFMPVINLVHQTKVVLASDALGVSTLAELVALARSRPRTLNYASGATGSSSHLDTELLAALTGMELVQIPYRGSAQTVAALIAGEVQVLLASITAAQPALASGKARALAVLSDRRSPLLPDVPTAAEAGLPRLDVQTWIGFLAPAGTPTRIADRLNRTLNEILGSPQVRAWLDRQGLEPVGGSREAFGAEIRNDLDKWGKATRRLGIRPQ